VVDLDASLAPVAAGVGVEARTGGLRMTTSRRSRREVPTETEKTELAMPHD
jgi:hypothetical protein